MTSIPLLSPKCLVPILCCLILTGCSSTRLAYSNLDWLAVWAVTDYVPLEDNQESDLKQALDSLHRWHCETQLPDYVAWLGRVADTVETREFDRERIAQHYSDLFIFVDRIGSEIAPASSRMLARLDDGQVEALFDNLAEKNQELREKHLEPPIEEQISRRAERLEERLERWFDRLSPEQQQLIEHWAAQHGGQNRAWLMGREQWQAALADVLESRQSADFERQVEQLLTEPGRFRSGEARAFMDKTRVQSIELTQRLLAVSGEAQLGHLLRELAALRSDLTAIVCPDG